MTSAVATITLRASSAAPGQRTALICHHIKIPDIAQNSMTTNIASTTTAQTQRLLVSAG